MKLGPVIKLHGPQKLLRDCTLLIAFAPRVRGCTIFARQTRHCSPLEEHCKPDPRNVRSQVSVLARAIRADEYLIAETAFLSVEPMLCVAANTTRTTLVIQMRGKPAPHRSHQCHHLEIINWHISCRTSPEKG